MPGPLEGCALNVAFQPIVELSTGKLLGHEALGRAEQRGCRRQVGPLELIERAGREGSLVELERCWWRIAIESAAASVCRRGLVFLNVHPRTLADPRYQADEMLRVLADNAVDPVGIVLEITEHDSCIGSDRLRWNLGQLARSGMRVALDDVGSGYATLAALVELRPSLIKLDQAITLGIARDRMRSSLARALAEFAEREALTLIAEGIETAEDHATLVDVGVRYGQGFLIGRPASSPRKTATIDELLRAAG